MKSYVPDLQGLYRALLEDCSIQLPAYRSEMLRDLSRMLSLLQTRGLSILTIDFPAQGKHLDRCLSLGHLSPSEAAGFGRLRRGSKVPDLFGFLWLRVFEGSGVLKDEPDITAIFLLRQLLYAAKKVRIDCDESRTRQAVQDFFRLESTIRKPNLNWLGDLLDTDHSHLYHLRDGIDNEGPSFPGIFTEDSSRSFDSNLLATIQATADIVARSLGRFDPDDWRFKHGPGAVADISGPIKFKYGFPNWPAKLDHIFPMSRFAFANYDHWVDALQTGGDYYGLSYHEPPSRLLAVPKTQKGPRLIAAEPVAHQWCQQAVKDFLAARVAKSPISEAIRFRDQSRNQELARSASLDGSHWTIDLSDASDRLSLWVVERVFRENPSLLRALHASRTRWLVAHRDGEHPEYTILRKFKPQGAATTFPVQTIVFTILACGVAIHKLRLPVTRDLISKVARETRVFGDDIIVPREVGADLIRVLTYCGLKVNESKTYGTGRFRESCGFDAYAGVEVTPAYYLERYEKSRPSTVSTTVETSNNFFLKGLWVTSEWIKSTLPQHVLARLAVVPTVTGDFGLKSFSGGSTAHLQRKWDEGTQSWMVRIADVITSVTRVEDEGTSSLLQYFTEDPEPDTDWSAGIVSRTRSRVGTRWVPEPAWAAKAA